MAYTLFIFIPVTTCIFWMVIHMLMASKTETFPEFICLCLMCGIYLFADACHATQPRGSALDTGSLIASLFAGPSIIPLIVMYLQKLMHNKRKHPLSYMWILIPTVLFTGGILLYFLNFEERVNNVFNIIVGPIFHGVLAVEIIFFLIFIIRTLSFSKVLPGSIFSFIFKQKPISLTRLQIDVIIIPLGIMVLRIILSDNLYTMQPWIAIVSAAIIFTTLYIFGLNALFGVQTIVSWEDFRYMLRYNYNSTNKAEVIEKMMEDLLDDAEEEALKHIQEKIGENLHIEQWRSGVNSAEKQKIQANKIFAAVSNSWEEDSLIGRFQHLMMDERLFLHPRLTLDEVADRLNSNKTYVSKMVNNTYNLGFPELINTLRVDYAEQYILTHHDAKQEEIAAECGFLSASSFNTTFKKVTGMTPKVWIASVKRNNQ